MIEQERMLLNPFPGLRPFSIRESEVFFGRDGQSDQVLTKLGMTHFVAVVGTSGSGKSSLVSAGLLPALLSGHMPSAGSSWRIASFRPGSSPIRNLAEALSAPEVSGAKDEKGANERLENIERTLRRSSLGLLEVVRQSKLTPGENLLILADQFEELFRFRKKSTAEHPEDEAAAFVKLLLEAKQPDKSKEETLPIYVVLTMRSDYLGDCAHFWGLPEAINEGQFLIPRMTDDNRREAIIGPIIIAGGEISAPLVNRLLNDAGDDPAQLPILQHALMRTWDYWKAHCNAEDLIDISHYEKIGGMANALSNHADEAFLGLSPLQKVAGKVFKALTEKEADNREGRRPATVNEIAVAAAASEEQVTTVIESFRGEGRSFLMPSPPAKLKSDTLIDISHESLIRGWWRLRAWVDEEADAARQYIRLADKAALFPDAEDYLRDPALTAGLKWLEDNRPTKAWAERYHAGFDKTLEYLELSKANRKAEIDKREQQRKEEIERDLLHAQALAAGERRRVKLRNWGLLVLSLLLLGMFGVTGYAVQQNRIAQRQTVEAEKQKDRAEKALKDVEVQRDAATRAQKAEEEQKYAAYAATAEVERQRDAARTAEAEAAHQRDLAENRRLEAVKQAKIAEEATIEAKRQKGVAETALSEQSLALVAAARAEKTAVDEKEEAQRQRNAAAELLRTVNEIDRSAPYFRAVIRGHQQPVTRAWLTADENLVFTESADQSQMWDSRVALPDLANQPFLADHVTTPALYSKSGKLALLKNYTGAAGTVIWDIPARKEVARVPWGDVLSGNTFISPDDRLILRSGDALSVFDSRTGKQLYRFEQEEEIHISQDEATPTPIFSSDSKLFALPKYNTAGIFDFATANVTQLTGHLDEIMSIAFSDDNKLVVTASKDGTAIVWDARTGDKLAQLTGHAGAVNSAAFSKAGHYIVTTSDKLAYLWEAKSPATWTEVTESSPTTLEGHTDIVTNAAFSPDGKWVVTISQDRTAQLWDAKVLAKPVYSANVLEKTPTAQRAAPQKASSLAVFRGHIKPLTSLDISPDSKFVVTGSEDRTARVWDLRSFGIFSVASAQLKASAEEYLGKCPANVKLTGTISVAGRSGMVEYKFLRSDGSESLPQLLSFDGAGSKEVSDTRQVYSPGVSRAGRPLPVDGWVEIEILKPTQMKSNRATFTVKCGDDDFHLLPRRNVTVRELQEIMPAASEAKRTLYLPYLQKAMDEFGINTPLRQAAFLAEVAQNTAQLTNLVELGTDQSLEQRYGSRKDLGNFEPGDGARYKGRGAFQITGRARYQAIGAQIGVDLIAEPEKAAAPEVAFRTAALYWQKNGLNEKADEASLPAIHLRVNGSRSVPAELQALYDRAKRVLGVQ